MVVVRGLSLDELIRRSNTVDTVIERELRAVARQAAGSLGQVVVAAPAPQATSPNDVNVIRTLWRELVDKTLMAHVADALFAASRAVARDFNRILDKVLSEQPTWRPPDTRGADGRRQAPPQRAGQRVRQPPPSNRGTDGNVDLDLPNTDDFYLDPLDENQATEAILANARNRLVGIGDELWEHARAELVTGLNEGESVDKLAARVRDAADLTAPRARTVARTEVIGACNAGSILTMRSADLAASKVWLATPDTRTRLDHRLAQGQTVPLDAPFVVGGVPLDHPGDDAGPPEAVINCRCSLAYDIEDLPTPAGEDDSDDIEGFDPSMFPDVEFATESGSLMINHNPLTLSAPMSARRSDTLSTSSSPAEVTVPWHIERNHSGCDPDQWAVVKSEEDTVEDCFDDRAEAVALFDKLTTGEPADRDDAEEDMALEDKPAGDGEEEQCPPGQRWDAEAEECVPGEGEQETASNRRTSFAADKPKSKSKTKPPAGDAEGECPEGQHLDEESGECVPDEELSGNVDVQGVAVVEGMWTGDGRQFALGALAWPDPGETNLALQWQKETSHGGDNDNTVNVGWLTTLERDGDKILVTGVIDTDSTDGAEAARALAKRGRFGVSIVADNPDDSEIEFVYPEECDAALESDDVDEELPMACFMPKAIFHSGRIRALTIVDVPAFVEAYIEPADAESLQASGQTFGAVAAHETATSDSDWDAAAQEKKLGDEVTLDAARGMYAWVDEEAAEDDVIAKSACKFPHHEVSDDGAPGAANLTACSAGIGALNGARGGADIPTGDRQGVYDHLAAHLRDGDQEPPPPSFVLKAAIAPLIAAAHKITLSDTPPASWFQEPADLPEVGAIAVTDEGRVYGLLAPRHVAHRSFEKRVTVPTGNVDYSRWMNRQTIVAGGERVTTGPITMGCGHAATDPWVSADSSLEHYDNSCSVVATVRIGENASGVWIAGALLPDVTPHQVARMLACQLSGDWRPHPDKPGKREMCGALLVPVPGFPVAASASVRLDHGQLVAAAAPVQWQTADTATVSEVRRGSQSRPSTPKREASQTLASDGLPSWEDVQRRRQNRVELQELSTKIGIEA